MLTFFYITMACAAGICLNRVIKADTATESVMAGATGLSVLYFLIVFIGKLA